MSSASPSSDTVTVAPPRWARGVDLLCLLLVAVAVVVAGWGGFRERVARHPHRAHVAVSAADRGRRSGRSSATRSSPRPPIVRDLPRRIARGVADAGRARSPRLAFVGTRPAILFVGYFAVITLGYSNNGRPPLRFVENEFLNLQGQWDTAWYMSIVVDGYRYRTHDRDRAAEHRVLSGAARSRRASSAGCSADRRRRFCGAARWSCSAAFFWSLVYLYRLAREFLDDEDAARWAVWVTAAYPFALFFSALYTESFFLLGSAGAFYHFRRREFVKAAIWGLLVGLTRPNGCFLSIPLALIAIAPWLPRVADGRRRRPG